MALEETPWLVDARGGKDAGEGLANVLDPRVAKAEREAALAKLRKAQTSIGGFPWWPGGPPSPYMTLYILHGLAKASEFGVEVPRDMVEKGWGYVAKHYREELRDMMKKDCCWETLTFVNYVASCYPDASWMGDALTAEERKEILAFSFKHWKEHSPYLKGYLALTLKRMDRPKDAQLVFESVMDSAKTNEEQGTFWAQEDRSWLWYNDTIETHAFALRTLTELTPKDPRRDGLVQWLFLNKKLNQWKSTRATAEVLYSLVHYLKAEGALGGREDDEGDRRRPRDGLHLRARQVHRQEEPGRHPRAAGRPEDDLDDRGREGRQGLRLRLGHLALLDREAPRGGPRRLLPRSRASTSCARTPVRSGSSGRSPTAPR